MNTFRLGWVVNPLAGIGGPAAFKGSDAPAVQQAAQRGQLELTAPQRAATFLDLLTPVANDITIVTVPGPMGEELLHDSVFSRNLVKYQPALRTNYRDTEQAVAAIAAVGVDLLVFVGGDGTARDVCRVVGTSQPVLGVPAGVKMHSGVYAINPQAAAEVVKLLVRRELVGLVEQEVRDIDEEAFRQGRVVSRHFGHMVVPEERRFVQQVKQGSGASEDMELLDISDYLAEMFTHDTLIIFGPGSTTHQIMANMQWDGTLLGVDLVLNGEVVHADADASAIQAQVEQHRGPIKLVITAIGGQGHILGRGNQQLRPALLAKIGRENVCVVATKAKLNALSARPLLIDSGDPSLDSGWSGYVPVITGYNEVVLYPVGYEQTAER